MGHQHGKKNFWKSSWLRKEIVSHIERFKRPYKNEQGCLFWWTFGFQGPQQPNSLQSRWQFQMSHIEVFSGAGFCSFTGTHTLSLAEMFRLVCGHCGTAAPHPKRPLHSFPSACRWSLILVQLPGTFTKRWNPAVELCKILYLWRDSYLSTDQSWITRDRCTPVKSSN